MGSWLRIRGQVPITISPVAWDTFSKRHKQNLSCYVQEDFVLAFSEIKKIIVEVFEKNAGFGLDNACYVSYNRLNHPNVDFRTYKQTYDYSCVLLNLNIWDRHLMVYGGLRILRTIQRELSKVGVLMPLTQWDVDRLLDEYEKMMGISKTVKDYHYRHEDECSWKMSEFVSKIIPSDNRPSAFPVCLRVGSDAEEHFVLFDSGEVYVQKVKEYDWDWSVENGMELADYTRWFEAKKALDSFNYYKSKSRRGKAKTARRHRATVGKTIRRETSE